MGRFDNKWSEEHRVAITGAVLDDGLKVTEVLRRAKAGNLLELEPFDMPYATARTYIGREQHRRDANRLATLTAEEANADTHALVRRMYDYPTER